MPQIIIIEALERSSSLKGLLESLQKSGIDNAILIGKTLPKEGIAKSNFISWSRGNLTKPIEKALNKTSDKWLILLSSEAPLTEKQVRSIASESTKFSSDTVAYLPVKADKSAIEFTDKKVSSLIPCLATNRPFPGMCLVTSAAYLKKFASLGAESAVELIASALLLAVPEGKTITKLSEQLKISGEALQLHPLQLTGPECARCVRNVAESCNIEDLFPSYPWEKHKEESLAACYHTLAALFIKLGDYDSAKDVLVQADQYEDSPRSLALRGIIFARKNDWLNAAANLIASLQQYETRLREPEGHYIKFTPKDFAKINSVLLSGLEALNRKNNETAVQQFADAIFLYDGFYSETEVATVQAAD